MYLTEAEDIKKRWQKYTELYKKDLNDPDGWDGSGVQGEDICIHTADSHCCTAETNTIL